MKNKTNIKEVVKTFGEMAKKTFEKDQYHAIIAFVSGYDKDGKEIQVAMPFEGEAVNRRSEVLFLLGQKVASNEIKPKLIVLISEAWMSKIHKNDKDTKKYMSGEKMPSQDPNKIEALVVSGLDCEGNSAMLTFEIKTLIDKDLNTKKVVELMEEAKKGGDVKNHLLENFWKGFKEINK